jgi:exosortase
MIRVSAKPSAGSSGRTPARQQQGLALGLGIVTILLVWPAFAHSIEVWSLNEEFTFGFLIPVASVFLVWWQRHALRRSLGTGVSSGLAIVVAALAAYLLFQRVGINALAGLAVIPLLWGMVVYLWGWGAGRVLAFPIGFLAFGLGLYRGLLDTVGFTLQQLTALGASTFGGALGLPVQRDGLLLYSNRFQFLIAEPCSGMSSLLSLLALSAIWVYVVRGALPARLAVVLSVLPIVLAANTVRVTLVLLVAWWFGQDAAVGFFHGASSLILFGLALVGLVLVSRSVGCRALSTAA